MCRCGADSGFRPEDRELAELLDAWWGWGFQGVYGRAPTENDFIVPDPKHMGVRTQSKATKDHARDDLP